MKYFFKLLPALTILLIAQSCAVNPVTGKKQVMLMSEQQEVALGAAADPSIVAQYGLYQDEALEKFVDEKGQKMAAVSHRSNLKFTFRVVDSPVVNAFALPGGYVYFTRGILAHFNNEAEFSGVLGHEIGHVTARHGAQQQTKAQLGQVALIGGVIATKGSQQFMQAAQQGLGLLFLKFGRDHESESDRLGVEYSTKIGYDAKEMAGFFKTLNRLSTKNGASEIPTFLSTHPHPVDRFNKVKVLANQWQAKDKNGPYQVNRNEYLKLVDGLVYGEDPRQGYVVDNVFYHPELKFQFPIPQNWQHLNSPTQVQMAPQDGKAMMIFTLSQQKELQAAANEIIENFKLTLKDSKQLTINGFPALGMVTEQVTQDPNTGQSNAINVLTYCIKYGELIYVFHGISSQEDFNTHANTFKNVSTNFRKLTDPARINVKPERIRVKQLSRDMTLQQAFSYYKIPNNRMEELAVINGMELTDALKKGAWIKVIGT